VTVRLRYDGGYDPPAPVVPIRIADPDDQAGVLVAALIDTGADGTLVSATLVTALGLPRVGGVGITGIGGSGGIAPVYAARVEIAGTAAVARLVSYGNEVIVGRDLLNRFVTLLDGPRLRLQLRSRGR
jgi:predicted aspartyl protease